MYTWNDGRPKFENMNVCSLDLGCSVRLCSWSTVENLWVKVWIVSIKKRKKAKGENRWREITRQTMLMFAKVSHTDCKSTKQECYCGHWGWPQTTAAYLLKSGETTFLYFPFCVASLSHDRKPTTCSSLTAKLKPQCGSWGVVLKDLGRWFELVLTEEHWWQY